MRKMLVKTAIKKGYRIFELRDVRDQQCLVVAIIEDYPYPAEYIVHDITHSKFISKHTVIGGYDGVTVCDLFAYCLGCLDPNGEMKSISNITGSYEYKEPLTEKELDEIDPEYKAFGGI